MLHCWLCGLSLFTKKMINWQVIGWCCMWWGQKIGHGNSIEEDSDGTEMMRAISNVAMAADRWRWHWLDKRIVNSRGNHRLVTSSGYANDKMRCMYLTWLTILESCNPFPWAKFVVKIISWSCLLCMIYADWWWEWWWHDLNIAGDMTHWRWWWVCKHCLQNRRLRSKRLTGGLTCQRHLSWHTWGHKR